MMGPVRVDLMASAVGKIGGVTWHHLFLVASEATGKHAYLRAGPQCMPLSQLADRITEHGNAVEDYEPSPAGPYGVVTFSSGSYEPGCVDFDPVAANVTLAKGAPAAQLWEKVQQAAKALQAEQIPFDPAGRGANWALMEALRRSGVQALVPPKRWAPGASRASSDSLPSNAATRRVGQAVAQL
jgi:hypothetical protein